MPRTADDIVRTEVIYCVSYLVSTLAGGCAAITNDRNDMRDICDLCEQAQDLAAPIDDWQEAAEQAGWEYAPEFEPQHIYRDTTDGQTWAAADWQTLCDDHGIDPYQWDVFEHWIVTDWLADKLEAQGEKVDRDFAGMIVWARTTTGQGIAMDSVLQHIAADLAKDA